MPWRSMTLRSFTHCIAPWLFAACAAPATTAPAPAAPAPAAPAVAATPPVPSPPVQATKPSSESGAHALFIEAASCWLGGVWGDALGQQGAMKQAASESRCRDVERRVWATEDKTHYEQLRALEMNAVADVVAKVDETAKADGVDEAMGNALVRLTAAVADEQKELMLARRAADRVKRDLDREPDKLSADEVDAVGQLRAHAKLQALLDFAFPPLANEARAFALLGALDHVELARGLPKHLKLYAVADQFRLFFGVEVPDVPQDATRKLVPGTWLAFLTETARAAGHPVRSDAKTPRERDALAWAGMLEGFHDKLKIVADTLAPATELSHVVAVAMHRLEAEYNAQQAADATLHGPSDAAH